MTMPVRRPGRRHHAKPLRARRLLGVGGERLVEPRLLRLVVADQRVPPLVRELVRDHEVLRGGHDQPGVLHRGVVGDDDLQVRPAVGAEQRGEPRQPLARDPQDAVQAGGPGPADAPHRDVHPVHHGADGAQPAGGERVVAAPLQPAAAVGLQDARRGDRDPARRIEPHRPVRGRVRPRLAEREVAVEPPRAALQVRERRDRVRQQRDPAPVPEAPGRVGHADVDVERHAPPRARRERSREPERHGAAERGRRPGRRARDVRDPDVARAAAAPAAVAPQPDPDPVQRRRARGW